MSRLTDDDKTFGPLTWGKSSWNPWRLVFSTGGDGDDSTPFNNITLYLFGWIIRLRLPTIMQPHRVKVYSFSWDAATIERLGRNWYYDTSPREYGFSLHEGFLQLFLGRQTNDSTTTQSWSWFLPWTQWRFYRFSLYDLGGNHFWTQYESQKRRGFSRYDQQHIMTAQCPKMYFLARDFDGEIVTATTHLEEREWLFGEKPFTWLSIFRAPKVQRSLSITFNKETGKSKGSWKGGTIGTSIITLPGERHAAAFRRYCSEEHYSKNGPYFLTYMGIAKGFSRESRKKSDMSQKMDFGAVESKKV